MEALFDRGDWSIHIGYGTPAILNKDVINKHQNMLPIFLQCTYWVSSSLKECDSAVGALFDRGDWSIHIRYSSYLK
jgi:hypothetical protein